MHRPSLLILSGAMLLLAGESSTIVYVGVGGCDDDDPTCAPPPETDMIYISNLDDDGNLAVVNKVKGIEQPTWLLKHPSNGHLYATESGGSSIYALGIDNASDPPSLDIVNSAEAGSAPVHLTLDATGAFLFAANYVSGSLSAVPIMADGSLGATTSTVQHHGSGVDPERQDAPHVHATAVIAREDGASTVYAMDLGLDRVFWYDFDPSVGLLVNGTGGGDGGSLNYAWTAPGAGPRHMSFTPLSEGGMAAHVICELSNAIETFAVDKSTGALSSLGAVPTIPPPAPGAATNFSKASEIISSADGRMIYATNRGPAGGSNSVVVFNVDQESGTLTEVQRHKHYFFRNKRGSSRCAKR